MNRQNDWNNYKLIAVKTVIKYAGEQGVKLRRSDFALGVKNGEKICVDIIPVYENMEFSMVNILIPYEERWKKQLKQAADNFLNYVNARIVPEGVKFSFTFRELDMFEMKSTEPESGGGADDKIEKVIRKITKLLALSDLEKNPSEAEAISASLAVQKLLAQYNLSMKDVTGEHRPEEEIEQVVADVPKGKKWKYFLANAVVENYACKNYRHGAEQIVFYGYKADVLIARRVFVYLFKIGDRLANQYVQKHKEMYGIADGIYNSFVVGYVGGVRKELEKQCTALALVIQPEVEESFNEFTKDFKERKNRICTVSGTAYREGFEEGRRAMNAQYIE